MYCARRRVRLGRAGGSLGRAALLLAVWGTPADAESAAEPERDATVVIVSSQPSHAVDRAIFGQFLEIASWGEPGPEAIADPQTGRLPADIVEALRTLHAPVIRFPGGSDIPEHDWTHRVGPIDGRPVSEFRDHNQLTNHFGYPEFLALCETLDAEPLLVLNLAKVIEGIWSAQRVAGLVAYCNAPDHPQRIADGREAPWGVRRWQIGNELFLYVHELAKKHGWTEEQVVERVVNAVVAVAGEIRAVSPEAQIIFDGDVYGPDITLSARILNDPRVRGVIDLPTFHHYAPWGMEQWTIGDLTQPMSDADADALWSMWTLMPGGWGTERRNDKLTVWLGVAEACGYGPVAITEWNWNGWHRGQGTLPLDKRLADHGKSLGNAVFLNAMIRRGDRVKLATQSMMLGVSWNIAALKARRGDDGAWSASLTPSGAATALWSQHHGPFAVPVAVLHASSGKVVHARINDFAYGGTVRDVDIAATAEPGRRLTLHWLHRGRTEVAMLDLDLSAWPKPRTMTLHTIETTAPQEAQLVARAVGVTETRFGRHRVELPPATAGVLVVEFAEPAGE